MNILLLNGGKNFGSSHGELNHTLHEKAKENFDRTWTQCARDSY